MAKTKAVAAEAKRRGRPAKKYQQTAKPEPASNPLPPPVEVPGIPLAGSNDPYNLDPMFQSGDGAPPSANSSISEPGPGEPLSPEAEAMLSGEADDPGGPAELPAAAGVTVMMPAHPFDEGDVRAHLEEIFQFLAHFFQSEHWALTERQSKMLGGPTAQLLDGVWARLSEKLPDILVGTPGAAAFLLACTIVVVPKATQQLAISRARGQGKSAAAPRRAGSGPAPVQPIRQPDPDAVPTVSGNDFMVTGD